MVYEKSCFEHEHGGNEKKKPDKLAVRMERRKIREKTASVIDHLTFGPV